MTPQVTRAIAIVERRLEGLDPSRLLLASDFDGTLADITAQPGATRPRPGSVRAIAELATRLLTVAVISGRSRAALAELLPVPGLALFGDYGLDGPTAAESDALSAFDTAVERLLAAFPGAALERKAGSTSIHFRAAPELGPRILERVAPIARSAGLEAGMGRMVVEVRPPRASKGAALGRLVQELRPGAVIFAGDDEGDRAAFRLLAGLEVPHVAIGVDSAEAGPGLFAECDAVVGGPAEMEELLRELARWAARPGPADPASGG